MIYVLYVLEVIVCVFLILVILLQQGSGADLSVFGGGASQTAFGARGTTQFIHKLTVWAFVAFIVLTLGIAVLKGGPRASSVMSGVEQEAVEPTAPATPAEPGEELPETASPTTEFVGEELKPADATAGEAQDQTEGTLGIDDAAAAGETAAENPPPQP